MTDLPGTTGSEVDAIGVGGQPQTQVAAGVRVFVHAPARRGYVATVIAPIASSLAADFAASGIHLSTGWRFGPHFDVRAEASPVRPIDWDGVAQALSAGAALFPPSTPIEEAEYLRSAAMLGQIEEIPPPYLPRLPHGHTEFLPARHGTLDSLRAIGLSHLREPLTQAAQAGSDGAALAQVAEAFVALADTHPHGIRFGTFSFRSHAEAFFHWAGTTADYRSSFDNRMGKDRAVLEELVRRARDGGQSAQADAWRTAFNCCQADFAGRVSDQDLERNAPTTRRNENQSEFHAAVNASGVIDQPPSWFAAYRLTINLFYEVLPALDVSPIRRFYLCHAIAQSVDTVFGETWQSRLDAVASLMAVSP